VLWELLSGILVPDKLVDWEKAGGKKREEAAAIFVGNIGINDNSPLHHVITRCLQCMQLTLFCYFDLFIFILYAVQPQERIESFQLIVGILEK
jgi:hypothetical protein